MHIAIKLNAVDPTQESQEQQKNIYAEQKYEIMLQSQYIFYFLSSFGRFVRTAELAHTWHSLIYLLYENITKESAHII